MPLAIAFKLLLSYAGCCCALELRAPQVSTTKLRTPNADVAAFDSPGSRLVLALGVPDVLKSLHDAKLQVFYLVDKQHSDTNVLKDAFKLGGSGLMVENREEIPFVDLNFDIVVVGEGWCGGVCDGPAVDEYLRVLRPQGKLLISISGSSDMGEHALLEHPLLEPTPYANIFVRAEHNVEGLPFCDKKREHSREKMSTGCQAYISDDYVSVDSPSRRLYFSADARDELSKARLTHQHINNAAHPEVGVETTFVTKRLDDEEGDAGRQWYSEQYLGKKSLEGTYTFPTKHEGWEDRHTEMIRSGAVKTLLDAGAGTCSVDVLLRQQGLNPSYVGFGFYDASMARICAERGSLIFDWDWSKKLAVCKECQYDMVFQSGGMHHTGKEECTKEKNQVDCASRKLEEQLDNFNSVLKCGGLLVMRDILTTFTQGSGLFRKELIWTKFARKWALRKGLVVTNDPAATYAVEIRKICLFPKP